ncbi:Hypothetical protein A7982_10928 [Minicystis rosea]|nr:Hypothetical protein A7982_10928 [Minicystis rosea]
MFLIAALALGCAGPHPYRPSTPSDPAALAWSPQRELTSAELDAFFAWTGALGLPKLAGASLVRVEGARTIDGDDERDLGFLIADDPQRFVVAHGLAPITYAREAHARETRPPSFQVLARAGDLPGKLDALAPPDAEPREPLFHFHLARGAHENGFDAEAARHLAVAIHALGDPGAGTEITSRLRELIGRTLLRQLFEAYGSVDRALGREAFHARLADLGAHLGGDAGRRAQELAGAVAKTIDDDRRPAAPVDFLTARVEGALRALRDDRKRCLATAPDPQNAEGRLRALGFSALPAVIALWDDDRVLPCIDFRAVRDVEARAGIPLVGGRPLLDLQRYRDVARSVFAAIAPRAKSRAEAEAWWANTRARGLLDDAAATPEIVDEARARMAADPARGVEEIIAAARHAEGTPRLRLVTLLAKAPGDAQRGFLSGEIRDGHLIEARVSAARGLLDRRDASWSRALVQGASERLERFAKQTHAPGDPRWNVLSTDLVTLMLEHASTADLGGLFALYPRLPLEDRFVLLLGAAAHRGPSEGEAAALLLTALDDTSGPVEGNLQLHGARRWRFTPRDLAGIEIAHRLAATYDCTAEPGVRAQQAAALRGAWERRKPLRR